MNEAQTTLNNWIVLGYKYIHNTNVNKHLFCITGAQQSTKCSLIIPQGSYEKWHDKLETVFEQFIAVFSGNICALVTFLKMEMKQSSKAKANPLLLQLSYSFKESQPEGKYDRQERFILATGLRHPPITWANGMTWSVVFFLLYIVLLSC